MLLLSSMLPSLLFWAKLTAAFTCASLPLNLCISVLGCGSLVVVSDLNKNFGRSTDLAKKRHESADLRTPIHPHLSSHDCGREVI